MPAGVTIGAPGVEMLAASLGASLRSQTNTYKKTFDKASLDRLMQLRLAKDELEAIIAMCDRVISGK